MRLLVLSWVVVIGAVAAALVGVAESQHREPAAAKAAAAVAVVAPGQDHTCIVGKPPPGGIDWSALRNPILSGANHGFKDQALQWSGGEWHMLYSYMTPTPSEVFAEFDVAESSSPDLVHWSRPQIIARNAASPDIVRDPAGQFVVTYQTELGQLEYRISSTPTLATWSRAHALAHGLARRMIDGALAWTGDGVILGFKSGTTVQHFEIAWAPSLGRTFHLIGRPDITYYGDTVENYEFVTVGGVWHLVATSNTLDEPFIFTLGPGNPETAATWLGWRDGRELQIPNQPFDTGSGIPSVDFEHANSAYLCVGPGGVDYLTFAAATELSSYAGWGHNAIGIARSTDLVSWQVPVEAGAA